MTTSTHAHVHADRYLCAWCVFIRRSGFRASYTTPSYHFKVIARSCASKRAEETRRSELNLVSDDQSFETWKGEWCV